MTAYYWQNANTGLTRTHVWSRVWGHVQRWRVTGICSFAGSGLAVVDDFGDLVEVVCTN
jgi:hypothetical protein